MAPTYTVPDPDECPAVDGIIVGLVDKDGPCVAKEASEGPLLPVLPSVGKAVYDAIGVRIKELPITPLRILRALDEKASKEGKKAR